MFHKTLFCTAVLSFSLYAQQEASRDKSCSEGIRPIRITARHIEEGGIGYTQGYTTLEGFISCSDPSKNNWLPFLDLRGHVFNNGKMAANAGLGIRYLNSNRIWGMSGYYDYRDTYRSHYNQVSLGIETLGIVWDFRMNGYLPVGAKTSRYYSTKFGGFKEHQMFVSRKYEYAFKGANAEVGFHIDPVTDVSLYFAGGPYYLNGRGQSAWGGNARFTADFFDCLKFEGSTSYDHVFKWVGQGQFGITFSFGNKKPIKPRHGNTCADEILVRQRAVQRVDRMEIVPVDHHRKKFVAINPLTGLPYEFVFVNNTSSSNGTFKSPYPTLLQAQNNSVPGNILYVFQGDGTTKGMDAGILLQDDQQLFGSGNTHTLPTTLGRVTIPAYTPLMPIITNLSGEVVTLANRNTVSGFQIQNGLRNGISGTDINGFTLEESLLISGPVFSCVDLFGATGSINISNNLVITNTPDGNTNGNGIYVENCDASLSIANNSFLNPAKVGATFVILLDNGGPISIYNNSFVTQGKPVMSLENDTGIWLENANVASTIDIHNNLFQNQGALGIAMIPSGNTNQTVSVNSNTFIAPLKFLYDGTMGVFPPPPKTMIPMGLQISGQGDSTTALTVFDNDFLYQEVSGVSIETRGAAKMSSTILSNRVVPGITTVGNMVIPPSGIFTFALDDSNHSSVIRRNTVSASKGFGIVYGNLSTTDSTVTISKNTVSEAGQNLGTAFFGGGIGTVVENSGNLTANVIDNTLIKNKAEGGYFAFNYKIFMIPENGTLCLRLLNNRSDTGYTLYNPDTSGGGVYQIINLEEGYQTNVGTINGAPSSSSTIPNSPAVPAPPPFDTALGGPITIVPANSCP